MVSCSMEASMRPAEPLPMCMLLPAGLPPAKRAVAPAELMLANFIELSATRSRSSTAQGTGHRRTRQGAKQQRGVTGFRLIGRLCVEVRLCR